MLYGIKKIAILSGGSGNDAILQALFNLGYTDNDIDIIVNAYDDGKSTGVCRDVTGTLGVSDIRKNHEKIHKMLNTKVDPEIERLMSSRMDITDFSMEFSHPIINESFRRFFHRYNSRNYEYKNFSVMNIVYSQMFSDIGYASTNSIMSDLLGIEDMVCLNSFDNIKIVAKTRFGAIINDEEKIVEHKDAKDPIEDIFFVGKQVLGLNKRALKIIKEADLIIISTGTFWSSIYPTLSYCDFYKYINDSSKNKLWVVNSEQDKDAYGVSSAKLYDKMDSLGLNMREFDIIVNSEADPILQEINKRMVGRTYRYNLGNDKGRNDPDKVARALERVYG